jgi:hypothetical protein
MRGAARWLCCFGEEGTARTRWGGSDCSKGVGELRRQLMAAHAPACRSTLAVRSWLRGITVNRNLELIVPLRTVVFSTLVMVSAKCGIRHVVVVSVAPGQSHFFSPVARGCLRLALEARSVVLKLGVENLSLGWIGVVHLTVLDARQQLGTLRHAVVAVVRGLRAPPSCHFVFLSSARVGATKLTG